jgi:DNA topoisomerase-1
LIFRYTNKVSVEPRVYKNLKLFMENKDAEDELFDRLTVRNNIEEKIFIYFI